MPPLPGPLRLRLAYRVAKARRRARDRALGDPDRKTVREDIALRYLRGGGLEVGALNVPLRVPPGVKVRYVDFLPIERLREQHAHLIAHGQALRAPDVVDDGERLETVPDASADFLIANHFIEHAQDPVSAIENHLRVVRPGGVVFYTVPDKRFTFDRERPVTSLEHHVRDRREGTEWSRREAYVEWARHVDRVPEAEIDAHVAKLEADRFSIHFHVWGPDAFLALLLWCRNEEGLPLDVEHLQVSEEEFVAVLRRC